MSLRSTSPMSKCAISIRPAVPIAAFTTASRSADVRAAATALANSDMSGWPMAAASLETTAAKGCAEITVARSTSTRRMAMRSIALTCHLTIVWSHDLRRASTCLNDRDVDDVFGDEPYLQFVAPDDFAYDQIVRAIISSLSRTACPWRGLELIRRGAGNLPVTFLVQVAKRHRVGQQLIQIIDALFA